MITDPKMIETVKEINRLNKSIQDSLKVIQEFEKEHGKVTIGEKTLSDEITYALHKTTPNNELIIMGNPTQENIDRFVKGGFIPTDKVKQKLDEYIDIMCKLDGTCQPREEAENIFGGKLT